MGGMGSALSLARQGFTNICVWEQALYLEEVGAGINVPPNLGRILSRWGVMKICQAEGIAIERANVLGKSPEGESASLPNEACRWLAGADCRLRDGRNHLVGELLPAHDPRLWLSLHREQVKSNALTTDCSSGSASKVARARRARYRLCTPDDGSDYHRIRL